jgi:hypothetical protein
MQRLAMFRLATPLKSLMAMITRAEPWHDLDEDYLAQAVDLKDLECRMRQLDERSRNTFDGIRFGLYPR